jgi:hypothetical protein
MKRIHTARHKANAPLLRQAIKTQKLRHEFMLEMPSGKPLHKGNLVLIRHESREKFEPTYFGPFCILKVDSSGPSAPLTGGSIDVARVLKQIRDKGEVSPIEAIRRGCMAMFERLSGRSPRKRRDLHCTAGDLEAGNITAPSTARLDQQQLATSGLGLTLQLDQYGFLWRYPPALPIANAFQQQQDHDTKRAQEKNARQRSTRSTKPGRYADPPEDATASSYTNCTSRKFTLDSGWSWS